MGRKKEKKSAAHRMNQAEQEEVVEQIDDVCPNSSMPNVVTLPIGGVEERVKLRRQQKQQMQPAGATIATISSADEEKVALPSDDGSKIKSDKKRYFPVRFGQVSTAYFQRCEGNELPERGANAIGMELLAFHTETLALSDDDEQGDKRKRKEFHPLTAFQRSALLQAADVEPSTETNKQNKALRASRNANGRCCCTEGKCWRSSCACFSDGVGCLSKGDLKCCECDAKNCDNPAGRISLDLAEIEANRKRVFDAQQKSEAR